MPSSGRASAEFTLLSAVFAGAGLLLLFALLAAAVSYGRTMDFDQAVLLALRESSNAADPIGPPWVEEMARDITALGSNAVVGLMTLASVLYLVLAGKRRTALLLVAAIIGAIVLGNALKFGFARPRPDIVPPLARVFTASFPSGHATLSAAVYLTLGALQARMTQDRRTKLFVLLFAVLLVLLIGLTRVYLGLHYPTDVLAGWFVGTAWAIACWSAALYLQRRGGIEPPGAPLK